MSPHRLVLAATLASWVTAENAQAHHVVTDNGIAPVVPRTMASLDFAAATFDFAGQAGRWESITPSLEWRLLERLSVFAALPLARVHRDDEEPTTGIGDLSLSVKAAVARTRHGGLLLSAGLGAELPTGSAAKGLGGGHVELTPFIGLSSALASIGATELATYGLGALRWSRGGGHAHGAGTAVHAHAPGSMLAPHGEREAFLRAMFSVVRGPAYAAIGGEGAVVVDGDGAGQLAARAELGWRLTSATRLSIGADATVAGDRRFGVRGRLGLAWLR